MASGPITSWQIDREKMEIVTDFIFLGSKITADGDCSLEIKRHFLLGRKAMTNLVSSLQSLSHVWLFANPWTAARQASLSITNCWSIPKPMCIESVMPSNHLILVIPFSSCPQSFPASGSFQMSQLFNQVAKVLEFQLQHQSFQWSTQDWSPLGWTGWISLQSKRLSRLFSNTTVQKHQFFGAQLSL